MKKSNKKIPKTHLPKYSAGGGTTRTLANGNQVSDATNNIYSSGSGNGTQDTYNSKRMSGVNMNTGSYIAAGTALAQGGVGLANTYSNNGTPDDAYKTARTAENGVVSAVAPAYGMLHSGVSTTVDMASGATDAGKVDSEGNLTNRSMTKQDMVGKSFADPLAAIAARGSYEGGWTDFSGNAYADDVEKRAKEGIAAEKSAQEAQTAQNNAYQQQQNDYINSAIQSGLANQQPQNSYVQYAMGGMKMQPNAEVEKQENTLNPDGTATQFDGPSHEEGGIQTNLDPGTLILSDKIKWDGKTAAEHNKPYARMIQKATKDLENSSLTKESKLSAHLNLMAATKASQAIFAKQEETKQSRIDSYTKRLGGIMKYPNGGITPIQYKQAQSDSTTLYNAGLQSNKRPYYDYPGTIEAMQRLQGINSTNGKIVAPEPIQGEAYSNEAGYNGGYNVKFQKPTMTPYKQTQIPADNNGIQKVESYAQPVGKPVNHPVYNQYIPGINQSKQRIVKEEFRKGGKKSGFTPMINDPNEEVTVPGNYKSDNDFSGVLAPSAYDKQMDITDANTLYNSAWEADYANNPNAPKPSNTSDTTSSNFDWKGLGTQALSFAANNAGNIFDLARADKTETRRYDKMTAKLLDPTSAIRDAVAQTRRAEYNIKNASGGNAGTYLANRVGLNAQNTENIARIHQNYANANAGIANQTSQFNTGIANEEILANAKIRANARNTKQSAIASIGSNSANQMNDIRNTKMDQKKMEGLIKMYPSLSKDPKMLEYFMSFNA